LVGFRLFAFPFFFFFFFFHRVNLQTKWLYFAQKIQKKTEFSWE